MPPKMTIPTGEKFGRLTVLGLGKPFFIKQQKYSTWRCRCVCGRICDARPWSVRIGSKKSCGCLYKETRGTSSRRHGKHLSSEYRAWQSMKARCYNPNYKRYKHYGGRGIKVCKRWLKGDKIRSGVECFLFDMGDKPSPSYTLDRCDSDKNYTPDNCRWASYSAQNSNRRPFHRSTAAHIYVNYQGRKTILDDVAKAVGILPATARQRYLKGWPLKKILSKIDYRTMKPLL